MRTALLLLLLLAIAAVPGLARAAAQRRPERRHPVLAATTPTCPGARQPPAFDIYTLAVVLGDLPAAVHLAHRLRHPAHQAPLRRAARPAAEDAARLAATGRVHERTTRTTDAATAVAAARSLLRAPATASSRRASGDSVSAERGYLRETGNLVFHTALVGVLVDGRLRRRLRLHRPEGDRRGAARSPTCSPLRLVQPGPLLRRDSTRAVLARARRVRRRPTSSTQQRQRPSRSTSPPTSTTRTQAATDSTRAQGQLAARDRRHQDLPARQRLRARPSRCATPMATSSSPTRCRSCRRTRNLTTSASSRCRTAWPSSSA